MGTENADGVWPCQTPSAFSVLLTLRSRSDPLLMLRPSLEWPGNSSPLCSMRWRGEQNWTFSPVTRNLACFLGSPFYGIIWMSYSVDSHPGRRKYPFRGSRIMLNGHEPGTDLILLAALPHNGEGRKPPSTGPPKFVSFSFSCSGILVFC